MSAPVVFWSCLRFEHLLDHTASPADAALLHKAVEEVSPGVCIPRVLGFHVLWHPSVSSRALQSVIGVHNWCSNAWVPLDRAMRS